MMFSSDRTTLRHKLTVSAFSVPLALASLPNPSLYAQSKEDQATQKAAGEVPIDNEQKTQTTRPEPKGRRTPFLTLPSTFQTDIIIATFDRHGKVTDKEVLAEAAASPCWLSEDVLLCSRVSDLNQPTQASLAMGHLGADEKWHWKPVTIRDRNGKEVRAVIGTAVARPDGYYLYFVKNGNEGGGERARVGLAISSKRDENFVEQIGGVKIPFGSKGNINMHLFAYLDEKNTIHLFVTRGDCEDRKHNGRPPIETIGHAVSSNGRVFERMKVPEAFRKHGFLGTIQSRTALISAKDGIVRCNLGDDEEWKVSDDLLLKDAFEPSVVPHRSDKEKSIRMAFCERNKDRKLPAAQVNVPVQDRDVALANPPAHDPVGTDQPEDLRSVNEIYKGIFPPTPLEDNHPLRKLGQFVGYMPGVEIAPWDPELNPELGEILKGLEDAIADFERAGAAPVDPNEELGNLYGIETLANAAALSALATDVDGEIDSEKITRAIESVLGNANHIPATNNPRFEVIYSMMQLLAYRTIEGTISSLETPDLHKLASLVGSQDYGPIQAANVELPEPTELLEGKFENLDDWLAANCDADMSDQELEEAVMRLLQHRAAQAKQTPQNMQLSPAQLERQRRFYEQWRGQAMDSILIELRGRIVEE